MLGAIWGTNYLHYKYDYLTSEVITSIIGMIFIGTMIGSPLCGFLSDKLRNRKLTMLAGAALSLVIMFIIMFSSDPGAFFLYIMFLLLGIITFAQTIGYAVIAESNEDDVLGTANGFSAVLLMGMADKYIWSGFSDKLHESYLPHACKFLYRGLMCSAPQRNIQKIEVSTCNYCSDIGKKNIILTPFI